MSGLRPIVNYRVALSAYWASVPTTHRDNDWPNEVASLLCDAEPQRTVLANKLLEAHPDLIGPDHHVGIAAWVPNRSSGEIYGFLAVDWMLPERGKVLDRPYYLDLIARTTRPKVTVLAEQTESVDLPAGPAVRNRERISYPVGRLFSRREIVNENIIYTIFPPGGSDALMFTFSTNLLDHADELAKEADSMAATVEIDLGEPDASS